jgi:membrane protein required for colicin V production
MNVFDIVAGVILAYGLIRGLFRGLVKEVSSIIGVLGGFLAAYSFYEAAAAYLHGLVSSPTYRSLIAFLIIFCAVIVVVNVLALVIKYLLKIVFLGWLDRLGGVVFGLIKGVLIVAVLFLALTAFLPKGTPLVRDSLTAPYVAPVSEKLTLLVTNDFRRDFAVKLDELKKAWTRLK